MPSPVLGVVLMIGITFVSFGSLVVFATTNHYEKESCINDGAFQSIYDTQKCPTERPQNGYENETQENEYRSAWCDELLYEGSGIWSCPQVTIQEIPEV